MATHTVWVSWREKRKRWEVGFKWEGKTKQYYSWVFNGQRFVFTQENRHIADEYAAHIRSLMRPNIQGIITFDPGQLTGQRRSAFAFERYIQAFLDDYDQRVLSGDSAEGTVTHFKGYNRLYWQPAFKGTDVREINAAMIREFYYSLGKKGLSKKYKECIMKPLKRIILQACEDSMITPPKFPDFKEKKNEQKPVSWVSEDAQDRVINRIAPIHRGIVRICAYHGIRQVEARLLQWTDIDLEMEIMTVRTVKGGVPRYIKLDPLVVADIKLVPRAFNHNHVFHWKGAPYKNHQLWRIIRKALDAEGFEHVRPHAFSRHSHATHLLQRGGSSRLAMEILGHSNIQTTERYLHTVMADQEAVQRGSNEKHKTKVSS